MLKYETLESKVVGFTYYPMIEVSFGIFMILTGLVGIILFLVFNYGKIFSDWINTLLTFFLIIFCMFLGKSLAINYMKVTLKKDNLYSFFQCMVNPEIKKDILTSDWIDTSITNERTDTNEIKYIISINTKLENFIFYHTINKKEAEEIYNSLCSLKSGVLGEKNK